MLQPTPSKAPAIPPIRTRRLPTAFPPQSARHSNEPAAPPPDGGLQAWLQVLIAHLISWIGSVQVFLLFFIGTFSGRATDAGYFRHTFVIGTVLILLGVFTTSKRIMAVGLTASGTTTGRIIIPGIFEALLLRVGFRWTLRMLGLIMLGIYTAYYYIGEYANSVIKVSQGDSINLLIIINGIGIAFATIYGLFSSGVNSLFPTALSALTTDMTKMGVRMGMVYTIISFATLTGTPIAGALISANRGRYLDMEMFAASLLMIGGILLVAARVSRTGWKLRARM
ncbi:MFS monocarboxylate transporter [Diaporthe sp. PMI_573]|nr:MFS monocarboxylate transporter [Diaporthaceae sp. PMI_573]